MHIITNWQARAMLSLSELPEKARADFDYVDAEESWFPRFVCYRGLEWLMCYARIVQRLTRSRGHAC